MREDRKIEQESSQIWEEGGIPSMDENEELKSCKETKNNRYHVKRKGCSLGKAERKREAIV